MAVEKHLVKEQIQFEALGVGKTLQYVKELEKALNRLEKGKGTRLVTDEDLKRLKELGNLRAKGGGPGGSGGRGGKDPFHGDGVPPLLNFQLWVRSIEDAVRMFDRLTRPLRDLNKGTLTLLSSTNKISKGWGWTEQGSRSLSDLSLEISDVSSLLNTVPSQIQDIMKGYVGAGISYTAFAGEISKASVSASDNAWLLYGSIDRLGDAVKAQAEFMDQFRWSVGEADREVKSIVLDAHSAGIATERFFGSVKDAASGLDLYGGQISQVSDLMAKLGENLGAFRGLKEGKDLIGIFQGLTREQKVFLIHGSKNMEMARNFALERLKKEQATTGEIEAQLAMLRSRKTAIEGALGNKSITPEEAARQKNRLGVTDSEISRLSGMRIESRRIEGLVAASRVAGENPVVQEALWDLLGPMEKLQMGLSRLAGDGKEGGSLDFRDVQKNLTTFAPMLGGMFGGLDKGVKLVQTLFALQGEGKSIGEAIESMSKEDRAKLEELMMTEQERAAKLASETQSIMDKIYKIVDQNLPRIADFVETIATKIMAWIPDVDVDPEETLAQDLRQAAWDVATGKGSKVLGGLPGLVNKGFQAAGARGVDWAMGLGAPTAQTVHPGERMLDAETARIAARSGSTSSSGDDLVKSAETMKNAAALMYDAMRVGFRIFVNDRPAQVNKAGK